MCFIPIILFKVCLYVKQRNNLKLTVDFFSSGYLLDFSDIY